MSNQKILPRIFQKYTAEDYLSAAVESASWIQELENRLDDGKIWRRSPELEDKDVEQEALFTPKCLYGGSAGIGVYFLRLYDATGEVKYLQEAKEAAAHIIASYPGKSFYEKPSGEIRKLWGWSIGLYNGLVGEAYFVESLYNRDPQPEYLNFVKQVADDLVDAAIPDENGVYWSDAADIPADGGFVAFLILAYRRFRDEKYLKTAVAAGDYIATKAVDAKEGGKYWNLFDSGRMRFPEGTIFPSFTHGTAGTGWIFAGLYKETKEEKYLALAKAAATFIQSIAVGDEEGALIPHLYNPVTGPTNEQFYLSTCGGPVGTTLLFRLLYEVTGEEDYLDWVRRLSRGIIRAGAPEKNSWGYWRSNCICCGSPGILEHFVSVYEFTGEEEFLRYAERTADVLLSDSYISEQKRRWYGAWSRQQPEDVKSYTGLYIGTSGAAASLLKIYGAVEDKKITPFFEYLL